MNLEDILKDPGTCFEITKSRWRSWWHRKNLDKIMAAMVQDTILGYMAAKTWDDKKFKRFGHRIADALVQDPRRCYLAGYDWKDERYFPYAEQILTGVTKDPMYCYEAGRIWKEPRFWHAAERIVSALTQSPHYCNEAALHWKEHRFYPFADKLIPAILSDKEATDEAHKTWHQGASLLDHPHLVSQLQNIQPQYRKTFLLFTDGLGEQIQKLPIEDFYYAAEAYEFARQVKQEEPFFRGLSESIPKGTVSKWAKTIIQYFRETSKGAGNYRVLEQAA